MVSTVAQRDMDVVLNGLGNVTPVSNVTVRAQVSGPLLKVLFKEGQMVKAGDVLAEIDPRPFQAAFDQAVGQLARDQAPAAERAPGPEALPDAAAAGFDFQPAGRYAGCASAPV
ncbi:biotin/lipoyl-binding protein [Cupriavidus basilensis]